MVLKHKEKVESNFEGTIIDIETIGAFRRGYGDSREYSKIKTTIFGYIDSKGLSISCAKSNDSINTLLREVEDLLPKLKRPFYAFNSIFERGVLFNNLGKEVYFERELNKERYERKANAVEELNISQYSDPFNDRGYDCLKAWEEGQLEDAIAHNRSCLLKEKDILLKRGFREPDKLKFIKI